MTFIPTHYHRNIFDWITRYAGESKHLIIEAVAGSGKTTTAIKMLDLLPTSLRILYLAFNKHIADELCDRLPTHVDAMTYHKLGLGTIRSVYGGRIIVDDKGNKTHNILKSLLDFQTYRHLYFPIKRLAGLCKNTLLEPTYDNVLSLALMHNIDFNGEIDLMVETVAELIYRTQQNNKIIEFDDMCWLPVKDGLKPHLSSLYDVIIVDELQDTNRTQIELALLNLAPTGTIIGVGDSHQSIYGFRGADVDAIPNLRDRLNADVLPLSITYRNPQSVVDLVNAKFPNIPFEGRPNAPMGRVDSIRSGSFLDIVQPGDMVLCRVNAPLVQYCFQIIRSGTKATIRGRDIGKNLLSMVRRHKRGLTNKNDIYDLMFSLREYRDLEYHKLITSGKTGQAVSLSDKVDTVIAISDNCKNVWELENQIETMFTDDNPGVLLSSVHKAKGLQAESVHILEPQLMPHPLAKQMWEKEQERNIEYVAYTRSLENLYTVVGG